MKCNFENGSPPRSMDPWCHTHRRSAILCVTYANEALDEALLAQPPAPQWTTAPPTEPGWYWAKPQPDLVDDDPCIAVRVRPWDDDLDVYVTGTDQTFALNCFTHWMRAVPPEVPK